jgi:hypothetical protein
MKPALVLILISLAFASQAFAVLRPLFPAEPAPQFNGELIIKAGDLVLVIRVIQVSQRVAQNCIFEK